jgi:Na+/proline symporter
VNASRLRAFLIGVLALAALISVIGNKTGSAWIGWVSFVAFVCAVALYVAWRRAALQERRARVFDREAKTNETRTRPDQ